MANSNGLKLVYRKVFMINRIIEVTIIIVMIINILIMVFGFYKFIEMYARYTLT